MTTTDQGKTVTDSDTERIAELRERLEHLAKDAADDAMVLSEWIVVLEQLRQIEGDQKLADRA